jgi:hypothetical protein
LCSHGCEAGALHRFSFSQFNFEKGFPLSKKNKDSEDRTTPEGVDFESLVWRLFEYASTRKGNSYLKSPDDSAHKYRGSKEEEDRLKAKIHEQYRFLKETLEVLFNLGDNDNKTPRVLIFLKTVLVKELARFQYRRGTTS